MSGRPIKRTLRGRYWTSGRSRLPGTAARPVDVVVGTTREAAGLQAGELHQAHFWIRLQDLGSNSLCHLAGPRLALCSVRPTRSAMADAASGPLRVRGRRGCAI